MLLPYRMTGNKSHSSLAFDHQLVLVLAIVNGQKRRQGGQDPSPGLRLSSLLTHNPHLGFTHQVRWIRTLSCAHKLLFDVGQLLPLYFSLVVLFHSDIYRLFWCFIIVIGFWDGNKIYDDISWLHELSLLACIGFVASCYSSPDNVFSKHSILYKFQGHK